jgi:vitamin B12/bleomycin/antimicrobial peptide transport system ATP-binding/permease protein
LRVSGIASTIGTIWRLAIPYFRSKDRWPGLALLGAVIAIELSIVAINVLINQWNARFYNALQDRDWTAFVHELLVFCVLAGLFIVVGVYQTYLNQWLRIRWRAWMTARYLERWLDAGNHYRMQLLGDAADNPDQRISQDIQAFVDSTLSIGVGLLSSIVSLVSFIFILWGLSVDAPVRMFGTDWNIPGYLVWAALLYAVIGTWFTHLIGRPLVTLFFQQQRVEADFRFNLVRTRENSEQIALLRGESTERGRSMERFAAVVRNWRAIMSRTKTLSFFTAGYTQASIVFPFIVVSPAYFAGRIQLGGLTQTASAFNSVQSALSFFINVYQQFAEWQAVIDRLSGFDEAIAGGQAAATATPAIRVETQGRARTLDVDALAVKLPQGAPLIAPTDVAFSAGDHVLVTGPSGSGKSTLFRAIGGVWPFGSGTIVIPEGARVMVLPQRPYLPIGSLEAAIAYPATAGVWPAEQIRDVLFAVGLPALAPHLAEETHWNCTLSVGEQQRLAIARAILHAPDYLLLDEATASLDEAAEAALYRLVHERLPRTTVVSIGHRSTLHAFHRRHFALDQEGGRRHLREVRLEPAAE